MPLVVCNAWVLFDPNQDACCAWRLTKVTGVYSNRRSVTGDLNSAGRFFASQSVEVKVRVRDVVEPEPAYFPLLRGPAFLYCGIIFGGISVIMLILTAILMQIIMHHVCVNKGIPPPFLKYTTKYRGW
mmetsp:Transcript_40390/g.95974  ORF Transcript_40390/g.95974 Transcript_40390/m.95974 type:complete len:128 (-) Transcript_40390:721-1104(-)